MSSVDAVSPQLESAPALPQRLSPRLAFTRGLSASVPAYAIDAVLLGASGTAVTTVAGESVDRAALWSGTFAAVGLASLAYQGLYKPWLFSRLFETVRMLVLAVAIAVAAVTFVRVLVENSAASAHQGLRLWIVATAVLIAAKGGRRIVAFVRGRARGCGAPTLIVGAGEVGQAVARRLRDAPQLGLRPVGFLDKDQLNGARRAVGLPILGASWDIDQVVRDYNVRHVIVAFSTAPADVLIRLLEHCDRLGVRTSYVPRFFERATQRLALDYLGGLPLVTPWAPNTRGLGFHVKYLLDRVLAALAVIVLSPVLGGLALAVLLTSGRPIIYRQERVGRDGCRFDMLKFRSMANAPADEGVESTQDLAPDTAPGGIEGADRRTRLGILMRHTSLDELPQLFNVLKGEMSFVGPRPERPEFVQSFDKTVRRYDRRHRVKSGITGWAQVNGLRGKTSIADRVECDNYYIENWSFWLDFKILLQTAVAVARPQNVE